MRSLSKHALKKTDTPQRYSPNGEPVEPLKQALLILAGPTASGKTAICLEISKIIPVEMISFDSMQVYRGMPIITQAPTAMEKKAMKAHLVSFLDISEVFDAARFRADAQSLIVKIFKRGRIPLLSGGTGLYLRALLDGLFDSEGGGRDEKLRKKLLIAQEKYGGSYLHEELRAVDAPSAATIHANDHRRLVRALEVHALSGAPISSRKLERKGIREDFHCPVFFLERSREDLYQRVEKRVDVMMSQGLEKEACRMLKKRLSMTASGALGLKEMRGWIEGRTSKEEAIRLLKQHTRNYAKRQISWFRHEKGRVTVSVDPAEKPKDTAKKILLLWKNSEY